MTQEEKQLLFSDLCARLPYSTIVNVDNGKYREDVKLESYIVADIDEWQPKLYLRPLSSMTKEERAERVAILWELEVYIHIDEDVTYKYQDWLLSHHFDFRNLIVRGLALEAPEGMYN